MSLLEMSRSKSKRINVIFNILSHSPPMYLYNYRKYHITIKHQFNNTKVGIVQLKIQYNYKCVSHF
jgi:hypothetical protein